MYSLINESIGCRNCSHFVPNCKVCLNKTVCGKCDVGYVLDVVSNTCDECYPNC